MFEKRFSSPESLNYYMSDFEYKEFDRLMSPVQVFEQESGSCHDLAIFENYELSIMGLDTVAKFLIAVDDIGQGQETHSFVYYFNDDKVYWFENAWTDFSGINEFDSEEELLAFVIGEFSARNLGMTIYIADLIPREHRVGETLNQFVDICMETAEEIK